MRQISLAGTTRRLAGRHCRAGFSLIELLIVVMLLGILAAIVIPQVGVASNEAKETALSFDLSTCRKQIVHYMMQHARTGPHLDEDGEPDPDNFVLRMTSKTDTDGTFNPDGVCGPYLKRWPKNPFCGDLVDQKVIFGSDRVGPRDGTSGWYFSTSTCILMANSTTGGESTDPQTPEQLSGD